MLKIYTYAKCSTCRKAVAFLKENQIAFREAAIRETPPSADELRGALAACEGNLRRLFNTSGGDYRELGLGTKLPTMPEEKAILLLASNGNLVKRPFVVGDGFFLVGFDEKAWTERLGL